MYSVDYIVLFVLQTKQADLVHSAEILPGFRDIGNIFYDGKGYYLSLNTIKSGKRYV